MLRFRGRDFDSNHVTFIRKMISDFPQASRRALSLKLCEAWNWKQQNGALCDSLCRSVLVQLDRAGHIELPQARWKSVRPRRHEVIEHVELDTTPLEAKLSELFPVEIQKVRGGPEESLVKAMLSLHHYLGYVHPVGEQLKYLFLVGEKPIGCMCYSSAARHLGPRDRFIGWPKEARKQNIRFIAYQSRFLILPWVKVPHLASHLLARVSRRLSSDWQSTYCHPVYLTETFVDVSKYRGTCYMAANWKQLGLTTGRGKDDQTNRPNRSLKQVWGYPLVPDFQKRLCALCVGREAFG